MITIKNGTQYYYLFLHEETQETRLKIIEKNLFPRYFNGINLKG